MQKKIIIRPKRETIPAKKRPMTLPDGRSPIPLGSGLITKIISTGGGMAVIYEIWNSDLEVKRAVKLLRPDHTIESEERFQTEMKISAKLHHPNIVEIYTVGSWNGLPYMEMEEVEGYTLEKLIEEEGNLPVEVCTSIGIMVGRALNYAHNQQYMLYGKEYQGVVHRDLKPSNIMVPKEGTVKLMDFGIATPTSASIHTVQGTVVGTLQYLAPEQLQGEEIDLRVDIYSLGTVLYEMLTGVRAFRIAQYQANICRRAGRFLRLEAARGQGIEANASLVGDIKARDLVINEGATFRGNCSMESGDTIKV